MAMARKIFKATLTDAGRRRLCDSGSMARKTLIATFPGTAFAAEREGTDLKIFMVSDDTVQTGTLGDDGERANSGGPKGWQPHIEDCKSLLKDHAGRLKDCEGRLGELEKDPSGARMTVSDKGHTGMSASKLQAQILATREKSNGKW